MRIYVKTVTGLIYTVEVESSDSIACLKEKVHAESGIIPGLQRFIFDKKAVPNVGTLADYNIEKDSLVYLVTRMRADEETTS